MNAADRLQRFAGLFILWFLVVGIGVVTVFTQYSKDFFRLPSIPSSVEYLTVLKATLNTPPPNVSARAIWLYDRNSKSLLFEKNQQTATSVASLAKLMTAYTSYETYSLDQLITVGEATTVPGNRAKFLSRDIFSVADLIKAMLVFSANDAAESLAQAHPDGSPGFVENMNRRAQELGLTHTHFDNSYGIDSAGQYSTAEDLGKLSLAVLNIPFLESTVALPITTVREQVTGRVDTVYTTNNLLNQSSVIKGMKTGTTELAGESLIVRAVFAPESATAAAFFARSASESASLKTQPPLDLVLVLLGSEDRYGEAARILRWAVMNAKMRKEHIAE